MGCKDDDTCDQPATKGEIEDYFNYLTTMTVAILFFTGISFLGILGLERRL